MIELSKRTSGVLMHISSLPGNTGIGTMGEFAYKFVDKLKSSGQTFWQILPIGPTGFGDSPYQSFSSFAGNPYFIDLDLLCKDGYLKKRDYEHINWGSEQTKTDYALLYKERHKLFEVLQNNFEKNEPEDYKKFCFENSYWLSDYALFMAIKDKFGGEPFFKWNDELRLRNKDALVRFEKENKRQTEYHKMLQYFFFKQWKNLKKYSNENGVYIIGDLPIYVASDSADVWVNRNIFKLDENMNVTQVAGCPPDAFTSDGQLWGNVVYDWENLKKSDYKWWIERLRYAFSIYDVLRIDHFRAFESYYCIKATEKTARNGVWQKGPGIHFWQSVFSNLGKLPIIAEDLGFLTDDVKKLLDDCGFPGMKVLQFAFDSREDSNYLPHNYEKNSVVYTGTHDNDTIIGWINTAKKQDIKFAKEYFRIRGTNHLAKEMMLAALSSVSSTCILTMQDLIGLDSLSRMNTPSTLGNNWQWRATHEQIKNVDYASLLRYTKLYGRLNMFDV